MNNLISLIICSRKADISEELKQNIAETIGCEYELCVIDNSRNEYSIFSAYNEGVRRAKGDILCFMHEDVLFRTNKWGGAVITQFADKSIGAVGFLGGHYLPDRPSYWTDPRVESVNYIQGEVINGVYSTRQILHQKYRTENSYVAAIDGCFMAIPRGLFHEGKLKWDEENFSGFHYYDMDMCMQINRLGLNIKVVWNILLEHLSMGNFNSSFINARQVWYNKWKGNLPIIRGVEMTEEDIDICRTIMDITDQSYQYYQIRQSLAYRLGKAILHPTRDNIKRLINKQ